MGFFEAFRVHHIYADLDLDFTMCRTPSTTRQWYQIMLRIIVIATVESGAVRQQPAVHIEHLPLLVSPSPISECPCQPTNSQCITAQDEKCG